MTDGIALLAHQSVCQKLNLYKFSYITLYAPLDSIIDMS